jgi:hypothetical protein
MPRTVVQEIRVIASKRQRLVISNVSVASACEGGFDACHRQLVRPAPEVFEVHHLEQFVICIRRSGRRTRRRRVIAHREPREQRLPEQGRCARR